MSNASAIVQSGNLYVYCGNNPILNRDPSGKRFPTNDRETAIYLKFDYDRFGPVAFEQWRAEKGYAPKQFIATTQAPVPGPNPNPNYNPNPNLGDSDGYIFGLHYDTSGLYYNYYIDSNGNYIRTDAISGNGPRINFSNGKYGLDIASINFSRYTMGGPIKSLNDGAWSVSILNAGLGLNLSTNTYIGAKAYISAVSGSASTDIPLPFTDKALKVTATGQAGALGVNLYYDYRTGRLNIGAAAIFGADFSIGIG